MRKNDSFQFFATLLFTLLLTLNACKKSKVKIGFIGNLSQEGSQLAIDSRNTLYLMVEKINRKGGINGRKLELLVMDDENNNTKAISSIKKFKEQRIRFIIGPLISNMVPSVEKFRGDKNLLMLSPSIASSKLTKLDDQFIRFTYTTAYQAEILTKTFIKNRIKKICAYYDTSNFGYTKSLNHQIKIYVKKNKLALKFRFLPFKNIPPFSFLRAAKKLKQCNSEAILIISNALNTANLVQQLSKINYQGKLYALSWAKTNDLISHGGKAVEKLNIIAPDTSKIKSPTLKKFSQKFFKKFQKESSFIAHLTYDAFQTLIYAIKKNPDGNPQEIKKIIIQKKYYKGLDTDFIIDRYGDCQRPFANYQVRQNQFIKIKNN